MFAENKAPARSGPAPWPVSSVEVESGEPLPTGDHPMRPHEDAVVQELRALGLDVHIGYWGVHVATDDYAWITRGGVAEYLAAISAALDLASSIAALEP